MEFTFAFLLALATNLVKFNKAAHDGRWSRSPFFTLPAYAIQEIHGKILGVVGYGRIGKRVAEVARALGMKVLVAKIPGRTYPSKDKTQRVPFNPLLRRSDFVTLHAPLSELTQNLMDRKAPNFLLTPHIAWASREARIRLLHEIALSIRAFQKGKRRNRAV